MLTELEELLALHNRILRQCWQVFGRVSTTGALNSHACSLKAAGAHLGRILEENADALKPDVRREVVRTIARVDCFLNTYRVAGQAIEPHHSEIAKHIPS